MIKQWKVATVLKKSLPEDKGTIFIPCYELWWRGSDTTVIRPLFPGYVFIRSALSPEELHKAVKDGRQYVAAFIKELHSGRSGNDADPESYKDWEDFEILDIKDDEAEFLDFILNFHYSDGEDTHKGIEADEGIIRISKGYREGNRIVVAEGPLKGYEDHIVDVNVRQKKAYLDVGINGHAAKAGLILMGKRYFYPKDSKAADILSDGTEIDTKAIAGKMMGNKK